MTRNEQQDISDLKSDVKNMSKTLDKVADAVAEIAQIQAENKIILRKVEDHENRIREIEKAKHASHGIVGLFRWIGLPTLAVIVAALLQHFQK